MATKAPPIGIAKAVVSKVEAVGASLRERLAVASFFYGLISINSAYFPDGMAGNVLNA